MARAVLAALLALAPSAALADELGQVLELLGAHAHAHAYFVETQWLKVLEGPISSSGELLYDAPDRLEQRTLKPRPESLIAAGGELTLQRGGRRVSASLESYPQLLPLLESLRATLAGDRGALERLFQLQFDGSVAHWRLTLVPRDAVAAGVHRIDIDGERDAIGAVNVLQADGDRARLTLTPAP